MSNQSLNRTSEVIETPSHVAESANNNVVELDVLKLNNNPPRIIERKKMFPSKRVNIDVLKQRLFEEKKKEKITRTIIVSSVLFSLGALTFLTY